MTAPTAASVHVELAAEPASVPAARHLVRDHLRVHDLPGLVHGAELLVSELVGNVVLHVGGRFRLRVTVQGDEALVEVTDSSPVPPQLRSFSDTASTGRGMRLVHSMSAEHGVVAEPDGKTIWVRLTSGAAGRGEDDLAAGFADVDWLGELEQAEGDASGPGDAERWMRAAA